MFGAGIEPIEAVRAVEVHRERWRPVRPRVILLAESHVYTGKEDVVPLLSTDGCQITGPFVRFVYCLGYGEKSLVGKDVHPNLGTPQFWKIFYSCHKRIESNADFSPILASRTRSATERLRNKLCLLESLKQRGVWLVDASIIALYRSHTPKPSYAVTRAVIQKSWDHYVGEVVAAAGPEHVIVVGKGVATYLKDRLHASVGDRLTPLPQPQARLPAREHHDAFQTYFDRCSRFAGADRVNQNTDA